MVPFDDLCKNRKRAEALSKCLRVRGRPFSSERQIDPSDEHICAVLIGSHLRSEGEPDVLIGWDKPDGRSDGKVIKHLYSALVLEIGNAQRKRREIIFQVSTELVPKIPYSEAVIRPGVQKAVGKQRDTCIDRHRICAWR